MRRLRWVFGFLIFCARLLPLLVLVALSWWVMHQIDTGGQSAGPVLFFAAIFSPILWSGRLWALITFGWLDSEQK